MSKLRPWHKAILAGLAYVVIVAAMTWPVLRDLDQRLIGKSVDTWIFYWNNWWFREALTGGQNLFQTPAIFHPAGTSLVAHSNSYGNSFFAFLFQTLTGPVAAYNLTALAGLWIGAMGMYFFVRELTGRSLAAFLAGFVFAFAPYHITQLLAHDHLSAIHWWPFFALFLHRALFGGRRRDAATAGLFAALTVWTSLHLGLLLILWTFTYLAYFLWQDRANAGQERQPLPETGRRLAILALVAVLLCAPLLWSLVSNWSTIVGATAGIDEGLSKQTDLLAYLVPPDIHSLWADRFMPVVERLGYSKGFTPYTGLAVLALTLIGVLGWRRQAYYWLISLVLWVVLAAGSALRFNGQLYDEIPLPYRWLGQLFPISVLRAPDRFNLLVVFSLAVLAGLGVAALQRRRLGRWAILPLAALLVLEFTVVPMPMKRLPAWSPFLEQMAADGQSYAVVDYPLDYNDAKRWLIYQTWHGKPTVEGHMSRYDQDTYAYIASQPLLSALYQGAERPSQLPPDFFQDGFTGGDPPALGPGLRQLRSDGVRYVLLHRPFANSERLAHFQSIIPLIPIHQDDALTVYDVNQPWSSHYGAPPTPLSPGVDLLQAATRLNPAATALEIQLVTRMTGQTDPAAQCQLSVAGTPDSTAFSPLPAGPEWHPGDLAVQTIHLPIPAGFDTGQAAWQITCPSGALVTSSDTLYLFDGRPTLLDPELNLHYDANIDLEGGRWWVQESDLHLALRWRARADVGQDYKLFVHLLDESGQLIRQNDGLHCDWSCPSGQWTTGQVIDDELMLPLWGLPPGDYRLALGLYDAATGQRQPASDPSGATIPDGYFILDEVVTIPIRE